MLAAETALPAAHRMPARSEPPPMELRGAARAAYADRADADVFAAFP